MACGCFMPDMPHTHLLCRTCMVLHLHCCDLLCCICGAGASLVVPGSSQFMAGTTRETQSSFASWAAEDVLQTVVDDIAAEAHPHA
jgi:hypothetical protein